MWYKLGAGGTALLKNDEALKLKAYDDATGLVVMPGDRVIGKLTIGWGHTGPDVVPGMVITPAEAEEIFDHDVGIRIPQANRDLAAVDWLNQNQFDAVFSFGYNLGFGEAGLGGSTLLKKLVAKDTAGAAAEFARWNHSGGRVLPGLTKRRADEVKLFNLPV